MLYGERLRSHCIEEAKSVRIFIPQYKNMKDNNLFLPGDWAAFQERGQNQHLLTMLQSPALERSKHEKLE